MLRARAGCGGQRGEGWLRGACRRIALEMGWVVEEYAVLAEWNVHDSSGRTDVLTRVTPFQSTDLLQYDLPSLTKCRDPPALAKQITQMTLMLYGSRPGAVGQHHGTVILGT